jgi:hypothetical protein
MGFDDCLPLAFCNWSSKAPILGPIHQRLVGGSCKTSLSIDRSAVKASEAARTDMNDRSILRPVIFLCARTIAMMSRDFGDFSQVSVFHLKKRAKMKPLCACFFTAGAKQPKKHLSSSLSQLCTYCRLLGWLYTCCMVNTITVHTVSALYNKVSCIPSGLA